ncbi:MAG: hypothetical protein LBG86_00270 [Puniceicoccales bacterium]|nr:hypothetical protein [Puniceicoccales bacterium]
MTEVGVCIREKTFYSLCRRATFFVAHIPPPVAVAVVAHGANACDTREDGGQCAAISFHFFAKNTTFVDDIANETLARKLVGNRGTTRKILFFNFSQNQPHSSIDITIPMGKTGTASDVPLRANPLMVCIIVSSVK